MTEKKLGSFRDEKLPPKHIAIIMDGNGRWAKSKHLPRTTGHQKGVQSLRKVVKHCARLGVNTLTLFAFSSENLSRPNDEISLLFKLFLSVLKSETKKLKDNNISLKIIGDLSVFPTEIQLLATDAEKGLSKNTGLAVVVAANYSGQWDITEATKKIAVKALKGDINPDNIDINVFEEHTALAGYPKVDLLIRTSGELRISNFILWNLAYSELYFCNTLWPDFDEHELDIAIESYHSRERRFGGRNKEI